MKTTLPLIIAIAGLFVVSAPAQAATVISVQYTTATSQLIGSNTAGVDAVSGWNADLNAAAMSNLLASTGASSGISVSTATTTTNPSEVHSVFGQSYGFVGGSAGDAALFNAGILGGYSNASSFTLSLTGLNAGDTYSLIFYSMSNTQSLVQGTLTLGSTSSSYYMVNTSPSTTTYTQGLATTSGAATSGNYFEFDNITGVSSLDFSLANIGGAFADMPGFQLIDTTAGTPEPSTVALFAMAITGLAIQLGRKRRALALV